VLFSKKTNGQHLAENMDYLHYLSALGMPGLCLLSGFLLLILIPSSL